MSKRLGGIIGSKHKTSSWHSKGFPDGSIAVDDACCNYSCSLGLLVPTLVTIELIFTHHSRQSNIIIPVLFFLLFKAQNKV